jgi:hypothetical protein
MIGAEIGDVKIRKVLLIVSIIDLCTFTCFASLHKVFESRVHFIFSNDLGIFLFRMKIFLNILV